MAFPFPSFSLDPPAGLSAQPCGPLRSLFLIPPLLPAGSGFLPRATCSRPSARVRHVMLAPLGLGNRSSPGEKPRLLRHPLSPLARYFSAFPERKPRPAHKGKGGGTSRTLVFTSLPEAGILVPPLPLQALFCPQNRVPALPTQPESFCSVHLLVGLLFFPHGGKRFHLYGHLSWKMAAPAVPFPATSLCRV